jgi:hypothetical protein
MIVISRHRSRSKRITRIDNVPTPAEISRLTAEIRKTWSAREHFRRANSPGFIQVPQMPLEPRRKGF